MFYIAYGLVTSSAIAFPNFKPVSAASPDVVIRLGSVDHPPWQPRSNAVVTDSGVFQFWNNLGTMLVRDGREIFIDPIPAIDERVLRLAILGHGFGLVLRQRGRLVLHASSVDIDGKAVAFVGNPGRGKSTFALALLEQGYKLGADDVTALVLNGRRASALPAVPQINVEPDAAEAFSLDVQFLEYMEPTSNKRILPITDRFMEGARPLTHIFELDYGDSFAVARLAPSEAFSMLLLHSYRALFTVPEEAAHMSQLANLIKITPVFRITVPWSLTELPAVAQRVAAFVMNTPSDGDGN